MQEPVVRKSSQFYPAELGKTVVISGKAGDRNPEPKKLRGRSGVGNALERSLYFMLSGWRLFNAYREPGGSRFRERTL